MIAFRYHRDIFVRFPTLVGGIILGENLHNQATPETLRKEFFEVQRRVATRIGATPLSELEPLAAWRQAFRAFGVDPTKYRSAPEALLRRLTKKGDIPSINALVDINNMISIQYALPVATLDKNGLELPVTVHFSDGSERYVPLGEEESEHPEVGEVIFTDTTRLVVARRWCWRQSEESAAKPETRSTIMTIEAMHANARADVEAAIQEYLGLLTQYVGGEYRSAILDAEHLQIEE